MNFRSSLAALFLMLSTMPLVWAQASTYAGELDLGVKASLTGRYEDAVIHFRQAIAAAPDQPTAHLYLATAYAEKYIPGVERPDNVAIADAAVGQFKKVLSLNPPPQIQLAALKALGSLYFNMKKFDLARETHLKVTELDPEDPETYFALGVIDWTESYKVRMAEKARLKLRADQPLINSESCWMVRAANEIKVNDGLDTLTKAISRRHDYDDAMAYMNLLFRERADTQCGNSEAYRRDLTQADKWVDLTMATKKHKAEKPSSSPAPPRRPD
jgi:tetratricopeptide (TPR) repeat protein